MKKWFRIFGEVYGVIIAIMSLLINLGLMKYDDIYFKSQVLTAFSIVIALVANVDRKLDRLDDIPVDNFIDVV
jgi:multisubunit Na+/H+ antiporter MnhG subunit